MNFTQTAKLRSTHNDPTFDNIRVNKEDLVLAIRKNMESHKKVYEESLDGYLTETKKLLQEKTELIESGKHVPIHISCSPPTNHLNQYQTAITMLEWSQDDHIYLSQQDVQQYILDEWSWSKGFLQGAAPYSTAASGLCQSRNYLAGA